MLDQWIFGGDGFIVVFAIDDAESFENAKIRIQKIIKNKEKNVPIIVVGNKCDLEDRRQVSYSQAAEYTSSIKAKYLETSALNDNNGNCKEIFKECANLVVNKGKPIVENKSGCFSCSLF